MDAYLHFTNLTMNQVRRKWTLYVGDKVEGDGKVNFESVLHGGLLREVFIVFVVSYCT